MARHKGKKFNFSYMSERIIFFTQSPQGSLIEKWKCWAHVIKDGFIRSETDNFFRVVVREHKEVMEALSLTTRIKWRDMWFLVFSWQIPSYEDRGFVEIIIKQIPNLENVGDKSDNSLFKDFVDIYRMIAVPKMEYGIETYEYIYDFSKPLYSGVRCNFSTDRNRYLDDRKIDIEHDSVIVRFNADVDIQPDDYIISPHHGKYKVDLVAKNEENILEAYVQHREVQ